MNGDFVRSDELLRGGIVRRDDAGLEANRVRKIQTDGGKRSGAIDADRVGRR